MPKIKEYCEGYPVNIIQYENGVYVIDATNEGGYKCTHVDLMDVILWIKEHKPSLLDYNQTEN